MHKTKVSRAVSELERRKLIARRENSADRRETFLSLTPAGRTIYRDLAPGAIRWHDTCSKRSTPPTGPPSSGP